MKRELTEDEEELAITMTADGKTFSEISKHLKFPNKMAFHRYMTSHQEFNQKLQDALNSYCDTLESSLLTLQDEYSDPKMIDVVSKNIKDVLKYRNRKRYGDQQQVEINVSVDMNKALEAAERRVFDSRTIIQLNPKHESNEDE